MHRTLPTVALVAGSLLATAASAETYTVCASGCQYQSINAAIDVAQDGDVILLSAEAYTEGAVINTDLKNLTIRGAVTADGAPASILDGAGAHLVIDCSNRTQSPPSDYTPILENLVIQNGHSDNPWGSDESAVAGLLLMNVDVTMRNCTFTGNRGAALRMEDFNSLAPGVSTPEFTGCRFTNNECSRVVLVYSSKPSFRNCTFDGNRLYGSPIYIEENFDNIDTPGVLPITLESCSFSNNGGFPDGSGEPQAGGIMVSNQRLVLDRCSFRNNTGFVAGALSGSRCDVVMNDCSFISNTTTTCVSMAGNFGGGCVAIRGDDPGLDTYTQVNGSGNVFCGNINSSSYNLCIFDAQIIIHGVVEVAPSLVSCSSVLDDCSDCSGDALDPEVITVCASGCQYQSINLAVDIADAGQIIQLSAETHREGDVIDTDGKSITIRGAVDAAGTPLSIIDGSGYPKHGRPPHRVLQTIVPQDSIGTVFENLHIQNGVSSGDGGGLHVQGDPVINNCTFENNQSHANGGGLHIEGSPVLTNCRFIGNSASNSGAGVYVASGAPTGSGFIFCANTPDQFSYADSATNWTIDCQSTVPSCADCGDADSDGVPDFMDRCPGGDDTIDRDGDGTADACDGCPDDPGSIDAGACGCNPPDTDADGTPDCLDGCPNDANKTAPGNCGCGVPESAVFGDLDCDGDYDVDDIRLGMTVYGISEAGTCDADINGDGIVDAADLGQLIGAWGLCP